MVIIVGITTDYSGRMKQEPTKYRITTLEGLFDVVTPENFERLSIDFMLWMQIGMNMIANAKKAKPELASKKTAELTKVAFEWIDDGKHDVKHIRITNPDGTERIIKVDEP